MTPRDERGRDATGRDRSWAVRAGWDEITAAAAAVTVPAQPDGRVGVGGAARHLRFCDPPAPPPRCCRSLDRLRLGPTPLARPPPDAARSMVFSGSAQPLTQWPPHRAHAAAVTMLAEPLWPTRPAGPLASRPRFARQPPDGSTAPALDHVTAAGRLGRGSRRDRVAAAPARRQPTIT